MGLKEDVARRWGDAGYSRVGRALATRRRRGTRRGEMVNQNLCSVWAMMLSTCLGGGWWDGEEDIHV